MASIRDVVESPRAQGAGEAPAYTIDTTPYGGSASAPSAALYRNGKNVSAAHLSGSASVATDVITTPVVTGLIPGHEYLLVVSWTAAGVGTISCRCELRAEL